jgi:hypothetical protein
MMRDAAQRGYWAFYEIVKIGVTMKISKRVMCEKSALCAIRAHGYYKPF